MALTITPLDAPLGARVDGFDFAEPLGVAGRAELVTAIDEHLLLIFRDHERVPSEQQIVDVCRTLGPLRPTLADRSRLPGYPEINRVSNRDADGVQGTGGHDLVTWHSDLSFHPPLIEFIYLDAVTTTSWGGATKWTNLDAAYQALDATTKEEIDSLGVLYRLRDGLDFDGYFKASDVLDKSQATEVSLVQRNPRTGTKAVWPNTGPDFAARVVGYDTEASAQLLARIHAHATDDRFVYEHHWQPGDSCLWLNTHTLHQREAFPADEVRVMRHVNILGVADPRQHA